MPTLDARRKLNRPRSLLRIAPLLAALALLACAAGPSEADPPGEADDAQQSGQAHDAQDAQQAQEAQDGQDAHDWLERIEQRAAEIDTLEARLRYVRVQGLLGDRQTRFGELRYDAGPPQRFAIHFDRLLVDNRLRERPRHYIFDGHWLAERQYDHRLFIRRELVPADADEEQMLSLEDGPFVLPLDLEKEKVLERFEVSLVAPDDDAPTDEELVNTIHLRLVAREHADVEQERLDVWYDRDTRLPVRVRGVEEAEDEHWVIQIMDTQTGVEMEDGIFDTSPPDEPGWQVEINRLGEGS